MELRNYQEDAVKSIITGVAGYRKIRVEIPVGLGRFYIMAAAVVKCIEKGMKVLVLLPDKNKCFRLKDLCTEVDKNLNCALAFKQYVAHELLLTTYEDFQTQTQLSDFDLIVCDGIHWGNKDGKLTALYKRGKARFVGFTSQVNKVIKDFFCDSECVFRYTLENAINEGQITNEYGFMSIVFKIFQKLDYEVLITAEMQDIRHDLVAKKQGEQLAIDIKYWSSKKINTNELLRIVRGLDCSEKATGKKLVLVINSVILKEQRVNISKYNDVVIVDAQNLIYMVQGNANLENELRRFLNYMTDDIIPLKPDLDIETVKKEDETTEIDELITKFRNWDPSDPLCSYTEYENICGRALKFLFEDELTLWKKQEKSNENLFRFDLMCKIKDSIDNSETQKEFWKIAEKFFHTKYIIFEFKNYKEKITQHEIFTTERYLYLKALRGIAIIISVHGVDNHADKAIRGVLRENEKLIISLDNGDIINMLVEKKYNGDATSQLSKKLDALLIDLEK